MATTLGFWYFMFLPFEAVASFVVSAAAASTRRHPTAKGFCSFCDWTRYLQPFTPCSPPTSRDAPSGCTDSPCLSSSSRTKCTCFRFHGDACPTDRRDIQTHTWMIRTTRNGFRHLCVHAFPLGPETARKGTPVHTCSIRNVCIGSFSTPLVSFCWVVSFHVLLLRRRHPPASNGKRGCFSCGPGIVPTPPFTPILALCREIFHGLSNFLATPPAFCPSSPCSGAFPCPCFDSLLNVMHSSFHPLDSTPPDAQSTQRAQLYRPPFPPSKHSGCHRGNLRPAPPKLRRRPPFCPPPNPPPARPKPHHPPKPSCLATAREGRAPSRPLHTTRTSPSPVKSSPPIPSPPSVSRPAPPPLRPHPPSLRPQASLPPAVNTKTRTATVESCCHTPIRPRR